MPTTTVTRTIDAAHERVFEAVADIENLPKVVPEVVEIELLSDGAPGVGTRFRETRTMKGRRVVTELEITEFIVNERVRMVADSHGTVWDSVFTVRGIGGRTELSLSMDARAHKLLPKLLNPLIKGMVKKGLERYLDAVKAYCER